MQIPPPPLTFLNKFKHLSIKVGPKGVVGREGSGGQGLGGEGLGGEGSGGERSGGEGWGRGGRRVSQSHCGY